MNFIKVRYLKADKPQGRSYTFKAEEEFTSHDLVDLPGGKRGIVVDEAVDMDWVEAYGAENLKTVKKHVEDNKNNNESEDK